MFLGISDSLLIRNYDNINVTAPLGAFIFEAVYDKCKDAAW